MDTGNNMKRIFLTALFSLAASAALAEPSTNVAWTADTLNLVRSGDATRGAALNDTLECSSCHGATGASSNNTWPSLSGQPVGYMFKVIKDYQDGKLDNSHRGVLMTYIVEEMSDQDIVDIGAFFAAQSLPAGQGSGTFEAASLLDTLGDPERLIPPCSVCHGSNGQGDFPDYPALAGQSPEYLARALHEFKSGTRRNDVYSRMRLISARLSDDEITELAAYFAAIDAE